MSETTSIEIRCEHCRGWFPSPIVLGGDIAFQTSALEGNQAQCPTCRKLTGCNKDNMRVAFSGKGGGFRGDKT